MFDLKFTSWWKSEFCAINVLSKIYYQGLKNDDLKYFEICWGSHVIFKLISEVFL